ncbi:MAG: polysaccharide lyase [Phycisphaeraceae bacterium]
MQMATGFASVLCLLLTVQPLFAEQPGDDANVFFQESFEDENYARRFTGNTHAGRRTLIEDGAVGERAVRLRVTKDGHYGGSLHYHFARAGHDEPEVLYTRYYLRFGENWVPGRGGKLPGPAGTYGQTGWGGRIPDGTDGWSARGGFRQDPDDENKTQLFFYTYHMDQPGKWGENMHWDIDGHGSLENGKWYQIDMEIRLNTPGEKDGVLRGWVNGNLAMERTNIRFRANNDLKIEQFWMNLYYGGSWTAPHDMHVDWDGVTLSRTPLLEVE